MYEQIEGSLVVYDQIATDICTYTCIYIQVNEKSFHLKEGI